jgi:hypothetical protein|tara:strand:- start:2082 stop:2891 length:810 start_codon:yes stop_codon:yes gene_type:complete
MGTNINRQQILSRGKMAIYDGVGSSSPSFDPVTDTNGTMELWLRARDADMLINTPPFIDKWTDVSSGSGIQYNKSGSIGTTSHPSWDNVNEYVTFDGGDYMTSPTTINLNTASMSGWCIAISTYMDDWANPASGTNVVIGDDNSNNCMIKFVNATAIHLKLFSPTLSTALTKGIAIDTPAAFVNNQAYVFIFNMDPITNDVKCYINGVEQTNYFSFPTTYDFDELDEIGAKNSGALGMSGGIKEYMVYKGELSNTDIGLLNTYMYNKII